VRPSYSKAERQIERITQTEVEYKEIDRQNNRKRMGIERRRDRKQIREVNGTDRDRKQREGERDRETENKEKER